MHSIHKNIFGIWQAVLMRVLELNWQGYGRMSGEAGNHCEPARANRLCGQTVTMSDETFNKKKALTVVQKCIYFIHSFGTSVIITGHTVNMKQKWASQWHCSWRVMSNLLPSRNLNVIIIINRAVLGMFNFFYPFFKIIIQ